MKDYGIMVRGAVVTKKSAKAYLLRIIGHSGMEFHSYSDAIVLDDIEEQLVNAGYLTWEQVEEIEAEAWAA